MGIANTNHGPFSVPFMIPKGPANVTSTSLFDTKIDFRNGKTTRKDDLDANETDYAGDKLDDNGLFTLNGLDFVEQRHEPKQEPPTAKAETPKSLPEEHILLKTLFDISEEGNTGHDTFQCSNWDAFSTDIRDYLLEVTPQSEREEARNEKLVSFYFLDKGSEFTDRYIEQKENIVYDANRAGSILPVEYLLSCLRLLVCGYQSSLFMFSDKKRIFTTSSADVKFRVSGLTTTSVAGIFKFCLEAGSRLERLKYTSRVIYKNAASSGPILVAFANCINIIAEVVANYVNASKTERLLDFYRTISTPVSVITMLAELLGCDDLSKGLALNRLPSSWKLLNLLYERCETLESGNEKLHQLVKVVLKSAADQWFDKLGDFIGLGAQFSQFWRDLDESKASDLFTTVTSDLGINLLAVDPDKVPLFFSLHLAEKAVDIMNCLLLLAQYSNENVMLHLQELPKVTLRWNSGTELQKDILRYRKDAIEVHRLILDDARLEPEETRMEVVIERQESVAQNCLDTLAAMDDMVPFFAKLTLDGDNGTKAPETLKDICVDLFNSASGSSSNTIQVPITAATNVAVSDLIAIQSWLMNSLVLKIVFDHGARRLLDHMVLIREIMLLGSGTLVFDLEDMIFGSLNNTKVPLMSSLNIGVYGDAPGKRTHWPPAAAETNRALPPCVDKAVAAMRGTTVSEHVLDLECMNFGMREGKGLPSDCWGLDATSVFYLVYMPPDPLSIVVTKKTRQQYNKVFGRLLKMMHAKHVAKQLFMRGLNQADVDNGASNAVVSQSTQFLNIVGHHFSSVVIDHIWKPWRAYLENEVFCEHNDMEEERPVIGLSELIGKHHRVAADLSVCFFQTKTTAHLSEGLDRVLELILKLARITLNEPRGSSEEVQAAETGIQEGIAEFLRQLGDTADEGDEVGSTMARLLIMQLS